MFTVVIVSSLLEYYSFFLSTGPMNVVTVVLLRIQMDVDCFYNHDRSPWCWNVLRIYLFIMTHHFLLEYFVYYSPTNVVPDNCILVLDYNQVSDIETGYFDCIFSIIVRCMSLDDYVWDGCRIMRCVEDVDD